MAFTSNDYELSVADLLKRVELSRPTLYRLLNTLEQSGFVVSVGEPQKFRLGPSIGHLAHVWTSSLDIGVVAQPMMHRLRNATGETVALFLRQGALRICVAELPSAHPLSFKRGVGYQEQIVLGASGRVILAFANETNNALGEYSVNTTLFNSAEQVAGSIAIFGPSVRLKDEQVSESGNLLVAEARLLSAALGAKLDIL
jgi:DNA-binding IclR family transcriptional regulator